MRSRPVRIGSRVSRSSPPPPGFQRPLPPRDPADAFERFLSTDITPADGFDCEFWVPQMLGVSGNAVVLMPNGSTYYYFSDNREFTSGSPANPNRGSGCKSEEAHHAR